MMAHEGTNLDFKISSFKKLNLTSRGNLYDLTILTIRHVGKCFSLTGVVMPVLVQIRWLA